MVIPDIVKDAFNDVPDLPASERPLICVTPRWMPEEIFLILLLSDRSNLTPSLQLAAFLSWCL